MALSESQRKANRRLGWALAVLALSFGVVFVLRVVTAGS